jgi:prevent-host-death family protein
MATTVGVRELKNSTSRIVREVREEQAEYIVTYRGEPVAVLRPISEDDARRIRAAQRAEALEELDALAEEVSAAWQADASALEILARDRSERCP